jgi:hypothetical protein
LEAIELSCAPPLLRAMPSRASSIDRDPVVRVELVAAGVDGEVTAVARVAGVAPVGSVASVDVAVPADAVEDESVEDESEPIGSAHAIPGVVAIAIPTPKATANPPTRPMYFALPMAILQARAPGRGAELRD